MKRNNKKMNKKNPPIITIFCATLNKDLAGFYTNLTSDDRTVPIVKKI